LGAATGGIFVPTGKGARWKELIPAVSKTQKASRSVGSCNIDFLLRAPVEPADSFGRFETAGPWRLLFNMVLNGLIQNG
jgi:hypothetical protein